MNLEKFLPSFRKKSIPVKQEEEHPFLSLQREMNKLFDGFLQGWDEFPTERFGSFSPRIDMTEDEKSVTVTAELPGMSEKDIDISLSRDMLTVRGEKKSEKEDRGDNYLYSERSFGSFSRTIRLPREIEANNVKAEFKKGILHITLPKKATSLQEARKIPVSVE